jgi:AcrR family transcriptional regulator
MQKKVGPLGRQNPYHHGDLHRALLDTARAEIALKGAESVSMASLARAAGVSQPAPYRHFADRDALLAGVAAIGFSEFTEALVAAASPEPTNAVSRMARVYVTFGEENGALYRLMFASKLVPLAGKDSELGKAADGAFAPLLTAVRASDPTPSAYIKAKAIWAQLHGLVMLRADGFIDERLCEILDDIGI